MNIVRTVGIFMALAALSFVLGFFVLAKMIPGPPKAVTVAALPTDLQQPGEFKEKHAPAAPTAAPKTEPKHVLAAAPSVAPVVSHFSPGPSLDPMNEPLPAETPAEVQKPRKVDADAPKSNSGSTPEKQENTASSPEPKKAAGDENGDRTAGADSAELKKPHVPTHSVVVVPRKKRHHAVVRKPVKPAAVAKDDSSDDSNDGSTTTARVTHVAKTHRPHKAKVARVAPVTTDDEADAPAVVTKVHRSKKARTVSMVAKASRSEDRPESIRPSRRRASEDEVASHGLYHVGLGAFHSRDAADHEVQRARSRGFSTQVVPSTRNGRTLYRVQAGAFRERTRAESIKQSLQNASLDASVSAQRN